MIRIPLVSFAALLAISIIATGCGGGGSSCPSCGPVVPPSNPTITQGSVINYDNDDPLDSLTQLYFYPYTNGTVRLTVPPNSIQVSVSNSGTYSTNGIPAGEWMVSGYRVGYEQFVGGPYTVVANQTNVLPDLEFMPLPGNEYIGSTSCQICHPTQFAVVGNHAHPYGLNMVSNNQAPAYPFDNLPVNILSRIAGVDNVDGPPQSWNDVTYVLAGYNWRARFLDSNGYVITGSGVQYNYETDAMVAYNDGNVDQQFDSGNRRTTGWRHTDPDLNPFSQGGLEGIAGTFAEPGVTCEACHGGGAKHSQTMSANDIVLVAPGRSTQELQLPEAGYGLAVACKECHTRDGLKAYRADGDPDNYFSDYQVWAGADAWDEWGGRIEASNGLIKSFVQYDEILGINPNNPKTGSTRSSGFLANHGKCTTCHNPHSTTVNQDQSGDAPGVKLWNGAAAQPYKAGCMQCHANRDPQLRSGGMKGLDCVDCHMPDMNVVAVTHAAVGTGPITGDMATHIFRIDLDEEAPQFAGEGEFSYPWITAAWACKTCHNGEDQFDYNPTSSYVFHNNIQQAQ